MWTIGQLHFSLLVPSRQKLLHLNKWKKLEITCNDTMGLSLHKSTPKTKTFLTQSCRHREQPPCSLLQIHTAVLQSGDRSLVSQGIVPCTYRKTTVSKNILVGSCVSGSRSHMRSCTLCSILRTHRASANAIYKLRAFCFQSWMERRGLKIPSL